MKTSPWPITLRMLALVAVLAALVALAGCSWRTPEPLIVERVVEVPLEVPASLLTCSPEPRLAQAVRTQRDVALFIERLAAAGADCRTRLAAVRRLVEAQ